MSEQDFDHGKRRYLTREARSALWMYNAFDNFAFARRHLLANHPNGGFHSLHGKHKNCPAFVLGSGPTLDDLIPFLKKYGQRDVIIAGCTQASTLQYHGIEPEYILAYDALTTPEMLCLPELRYPGSTLLAHPSISKDLLEAWQDKLVLFLNGSRATKIEVENIFRPMSEIIEQYGDHQGDVYF